MNINQRIRIELFGPRINGLLLPVDPGKRAGQDEAEAWMAQITKEAA
jgi:hypothetical protein